MNSDDGARTPDGRRTGSRAWRFVAGIAMTLASMLGIGVGVPVVLIGGGAVWPLIGVILIVAGALGMSYGFFLVLSGERK